MTAAPAIKGWCPSLLSPMQSGDGWLVRVKPSAATLAADAVRLIADAARRYGNGQIDLTARGSLQVRGLSPRSAEQFAEIVIGAGLASADPAVEAIRNVMASPLGPDDPSADFDSHKAARDLEVMLFSEPMFAALPHKFGILLDGGGIMPLAGVSADIMVRPLGPLLAVRLDGGKSVAVSSPADLASTLKALALAYLRLARTQLEPPRMRKLIAELGEEAIFEAAGFASVPAPQDDETAAAPIAIGFRAYPERDIGVFAVGLPFGRIDAETLAGLAALSERFGDGTLRATPWRALLIPDVPAAEAEKLAAAMSALGLIADPADPRLRIHACVGAPSCLSASVDTRAAATRISAMLDPATTVHVSGCAKSCAHRGPASITLVGRDGSFDLVRNGGAGDRPSLTGLSLNDVLALAGAEEHAP